MRAGREQEAVQGSGRPLGWEVRVSEPVLVVPLDCCQTMDLLAPPPATPCQVSESARKIQGLALSFSLVVVMRLTARTPRPAPCCAVMPSLLSQVLFGPRGARKLSASPRPPSCPLPPTPFTFIDSHAHICTRSTRSHCGLLRPLRASRACLPCIAVKGHSPITASALCLSSTCKYWLLLCFCQTLSIRVEPLVQGPPAPAEPWVLCSGIDHPAPVLSERLSPALRFSACSPLPAACFSDACPLLKGLSLCAMA